VGTISSSSTGGDGPAEGVALGATEEDAGASCCPVALENAKSSGVSLSIFAKRLILSEILRLVENDKP